MSRQYPPTWPLPSSSPWLHTRWSQWNSWFPSTGSFLWDLKKNNILAVLLLTSRASLTVRITVKNGDPSGAGKIWENRFFTGKMDLHGEKCTQIGALTCQGPSRTCQNFYMFTFKAVGFTFLKVTFHLLQKVLNRPLQIIFSFSVRWEIWDQEGV